MNQKARLVAVEGDQEEFADLIGTSGELGETVEGLCFWPEGRGDFLGMRPAGVPCCIGGRLHVTTKLGNTFTFELEG